MTEGREEEVKEAWRDTILRALLKIAERGRKTRESKVTNKNSHPRRVHSLMRKTNMIDEEIKKFM